MRSSNKNTTATKPWLSMCSLVSVELVPAGTRLCRARVLLPVQRHGRACAQRWALAALLPTSDACRLVADWLAR